MVEIDIVIPLGNGSLWGDNEELRHCLRGVERNLGGVRNVVLVGKCPKWVDNVIHIEAEDDKGVEWRDRNIFRKILIACNDERVSEDFLFMNDDHFLMRHYHAASFPYHYREEDMIDTINKCVNNISWRRCVTNTRNILLDMGCETKMFDTHCPIVYNKFKFLRLESIDWEVKNGYGIKSLYCNINRISGEYHSDNKIFSSEKNTKRLLDKISKNPYFSTGVIVPPEQQQIISAIYPNKSKYEK